MHRRFIRALAFVVALELVRILFHIFLVRIVVGDFDEFSPFAINELQFLFAVVNKKQIQK